MASLRSQLERLEALRETFGAPAAREKLQLLAELEHNSLGRAADVERLHEALCFSRAWPDTPKLLTTVNRMLKNFSTRADLNRFAGRLEGTGKLLIGHLWTGISRNTPGKNMREIFLFFF